MVAYIFCRGTVVKARTCQGRGVYVFQVGFALRGSAARLFLQPGVCPAAHGGQHGSPQLPRSLRSKDALQPHANSILHQRVCASWDIPQTK